MWCSTDWMVARLIRLGWVQELDKGNIPNADNLEDQPRRRASSTRAGSTPCPGRAASPASATTPTPPAARRSRASTSCSPTRRSRAGSRCSPRCATPSAWCCSPWARTRPTSPTPTSTRRSTELQKAGDAGQFRGFTGNEYTSGLASGEIAACLAWTGDVVQLQADNPKLGYALPADGHMIWSDNFVIPNKAQHKKNAEQLINYYYDPKVMAAGRRLGQLHLPR